MTADNVAFVTPSCSGCKHWDKAPGPLTATVEMPDGSFPSRTLDGDWGTCERIRLRSSDSHGVPPHVEQYRDDDPPEPGLAYLADGSGYFASLTTHADFGCTLHEGAA